MSSRIPRALQREIRERFANCCAYCRSAESLSVATFEIEHIIPRSAGGLTVAENLRLACPTCNRCKSSRQSVIDSETGELVPIFHPQRDVWLEHFSWNGNSTEIVPITSIGRATVDALRMNRPQLTRVRRLWVAMGEHPPKIAELE